MPQKARARSGGQPGGRFAIGRSAASGAERLAGRLRLHGNQALALHALAGQLAGAANGFGLLTRLLLGRLLLMPAQLHLAEDTLALHLLFEGAESLIDFVVANVYLHRCSCRLG
jgi:hypothetical protein